MKTCVESSNGGKLEPMSTLMDIVKFRERISRDK
jgi:hypothetical protein